MISPECRAAGAKTAEARAENAKDRSSKRTRRLRVAALLQQAAQIHATCKGGTWCDCLCVVPDLGTFTGR